MFEITNNKIADLILLINVAKISQSHRDKELSDSELNKLIRSSYSDPICRRIFPLVYQQLMSDKDKWNIQPDVLHILKQITYKALINHVNQITFVKKLIADLEKQDLSIYLLKSSAFNGGIYSSSFVRFGVDIDILTSTDNQSKLQRVLQRYATKIPPPQLYPFEDLYESNWRSIEDEKVIIDLHFRLVNPKLYDVAESAVFNDSLPHPLYNSTNIRVLSPEIMVLHLALHMTNDCNFWHYNLLDMHELICQKKPDLEKTLLLSKQYDLGHALYYVLELCCCYLATPVEPNLLKKFKPNKCRYFLGKWVIYKILPLRFNKKSINHRLKQLAVQILIMHNTRRSISMVGSYLMSTIRNKI